MLGKLWSKLVAPTPPAPPPSAGRARAIAMQDTPAVSAVDLRYPPSDPGIPVYPPGSLLEDQADTIKRLKMAVALQPAMFQSRYETVIERLASHVLHLPGSPQGAFSGAGGLFRACVESAFFSHQASGSRVFTGQKSVEERHSLEPRWQYVCFLAGLLYPVGTVLESVVVTEERGSRWGRHDATLLEWATATSSSRYYVSWPGRDLKPGPAPSVLTVIRAIVGPENLAWLDEADPTLAQTLFGVCAGTRDASQSMAAAVVSNTWKSVLKREEQRRPDHYGRMTVGTHVEPYLLDAMRTAVRDTRWSVNERVLLADSGGLYMRWPDAASDIRSLAVAVGAKGIPADDSTLLELLIGCELLDVGKDGSYLHEVADADGEVHVALKISRPLGIIPTFESSQYARPVALATLRASDPISQAAAKAMRPVVVQTPASASETSVPASVPQPPASSSATPLAPTPLPAAPRAPAPLPDAASPAAVASPVDVEHPSPTAPQSQSDAPPPVPAASHVVVEAAASNNAPAGAPARPSARVREAAEVDVADYLPPSMKTGLNPALRESLGALIRYSRQKPDPSQMRKVEQGVAVTTSFLGTLCADPTKFIEALASKGAIYIDPMTPGKKVVRMPMPAESTDRALVVIFDRHFMYDAQMMVPEE